MVQYRIRSLLTASNIEEIVRNGFLIYFSSFGIFLFLSANALLIPPPAMKQPMHNMNMPKPSESVLMDPFFFFASCCSVISPVMWTKSCL